MPFGKHEEIIKDSASSLQELLQANTSKNESSSSQRAASSRGFDTIDFVLLGKRIVLRTSVTVQVDNIVDLHKYFKGEERNANELLTTLIDFTDGKFHIINDSSTLFKSAMQEYFKE